LKHKYVLALIIALVIGATAAVLKLPTKQGLDLAGGTRVVLRAETDKLPNGQKWDSEKDLTSVIRILRRRIDALGVSEPLIQPKGTDQVIIELPGIKDPDKAIQIIQSTARMEFRYFRSVQSKRYPMAKYRMSINQDKDGNEVYSFTDPQGNEVKPETVINESDLILTGADLQPDAAASKNPQNYQNVVDLHFTEEGTKKFAAFTRRHRDEILAIILEGKILSAPNIQDTILDGRAQISGNFKTVEEAARLADFLNAGALPVPLEVIQREGVEATLGQVAVTKSVKAGVLGLGLVVLFMVVYYLLPGFIADIALAIYALLTFAIFKLIPVTITLPGIAAYILSIGMAVDANILIFERLKEELRNGKTLRAAIDAGFSRAFTSIFDSNMCTAITCVILYIFGTGPIRGFALVLGLGVVTSMFTAITATRTILHLLVRTGAAENPVWFGLSRQWVTGTSRGRHLNIVGHMGLWFTISAIVILPGMFAWATHGLNKGIDFTGGSFMQVRFQQPVDSDAIQKSLEGIGISDTTIQKGTGEQSDVAFIRTKEIPHDKLVEVTTSLKSMGGDIQQVEQVGGTISKELTSNAVKAVLLSALIIVLYLSVRFAIGGIAQGFRFGVCAILATLHDVLVIIGIFALIGFFNRHWEIDSMFVTALLTVIGFSTHDTIVIFDRIRENMHHKELNENFDHLVNRSILQSFARSINTSFTVILTLVALLVLGTVYGTALWQFVFALLIGVITGTYSSIFNASQLLVLWQRLTGGTGAAVAGGPAPKPRELKPMVQIPTQEETASTPAETGEGEGETPGTTKPKVKRRKRRY
jgi:SecD/SecF fusion protein